MGRNLFQTDSTEKGMVTKTRSNESMVDMEEMNEFRTDMASMKKDLAELKLLKGEMKEIKGLLMEICKKRTAEENADADATAASARGKAVQNADTAGPSSSTGTNTTAAEVRFAIEANTNSLLGGTSQGMGSGPAVTGSGQIFDMTRPQPTVLSPVNNLGGTLGNFSSGQPPIVDQAGMGGTQGMPHTVTTMNFGGNHGNGPRIQAGINRGFNHGNTGVHMVDQQRNYFEIPFGEGNHYAEAVIKGPRLEILLFGGEDPIDWLKQCEKFYEITGTPVNQWVNLAIAHLQGRAMKWYRGIGIPWQLITWPQWCAMVCTRFSAVDVLEAVELF